MKPIITREGVADAIKKLNDAGQKATLSAIHAALGGKGSLSTLIKFKAELEQQAAAPQDSAEGLNQFRTLWAAAVGEGRKQLENQIAEIRAGLDALTAENERLEAAAIADANRLAEIQAQRDKLIDELSQANRAATDARAAGEQHAVKLANALEQIQTTQRQSMEEYKTFQAQIAEWRDKAHALEIEKATLTEQLKNAQKGAKKN
jgi:predicted  nucleic acid-binding Zn-ribbon protein